MACAFSLFLCLCLADILVAAEASPYLNRLIAEARRKNLAQERYWRILGHYRTGIFGTRSLIDDPAFFLSPRGKTDPAAELDATLRAFFVPPSGDDPPAVCRFVARYHWLKRKLNIDASQLPVGRCERFHELVEAIQPYQASVIFPTYFMNGPASMFGHTLICIESQKGSRLLSHAINYSARTDETNGLLFALKGLTGFYRGYYSIQPYYQKLQEYRDISQRDIWEYPLNLSPSEVQQMLGHLWELQNIYSDYYFFDENCSYNLLFLLEAARPSLALSHRFHLSAIPIDTVKLMKKQGLIAGVRYRPSKATQIKARIAGLDRDGSWMARAVALGDQPAEEILQMDGETERRIRTADLAVAYLRYRYAKKMLPKEPYQKRLLSALKVRSSLGRASETLYSIRRPPRPDEMHDSRRLSLGSGADDGDYFLELGFRPAFSDLLDSDYVADEGIQLEFLSSRLRLYPDSNQLALENLDLIDIISISPRNRFFRPWSWKVRTGWDRRIGPDGDRSLFYGLRTGGGLAWYDGDGGLWYGFGESELLLSGALEDSFALGLGVLAGFLKTIRQNWKLHLFGRQVWYGLGADHQQCELGIGQNFRIKKNHGLNLALEWERGFDRSQTRVCLSWNLYF